MMARCGGILAGGEIAPGQYCLWVVDRGEVVPVIWPRGYKARLNPLELINEIGEVVASVGEIVEIAGGDVACDPGQPCAMGKSFAFSAHKVRRRGNSRVPG